MIGESTGGALWRKNVLFERFEDPGLAQYSYAVGCEGSRSVAIVDPRRDVDVYLDFAHDRDVRITHVLETHIHADFASGASELAARTGVEVCCSAYDSGELYEVSFPHHPLHDGESLTLGNVRLEAVHTPGHTPEHLSFLAYDLKRAADTPQLMLSGDFLFVGSLGRPDLIGDDVKERLAGQLYDSVRRALTPLPDGLEVHPGHGAGSMCGSGMGARPMTTLGFERIANPYLQHWTRQQFVEAILGRVPPFPPYYKRMKVLNSKGAPRRDGQPAPAAYGPRDFRTLAEAGHAIIDVRDYLAFGAGHVPRAFGIGIAGSFSTWASWVVPYETPLLLVVSDEDDVDAACAALARVGLDDVRGFLDGGMEQWITAGLPVAHTAQAAPVEIADAIAGGRMHVLDVRADDEWQTGHVAGARHIMGGFLADRLSELPDDGNPIAVICASGYRSTVAASILERAPRGPVVNVTGGMAAWTQAGLPVVR
jgi:hydroxyacylglutathione hydrolase